jgi:hypothetical protein
MKKEFDCVEMKRQIQAEHRREAMELGEEEAARRQWERVWADPLLGKIARERWPELRRVDQNPREIDGETIREPGPACPLR